MAAANAALEIDLAAKCIRLSAPRVSLRFEREGQFFYLLMIALVATEMQARVCDEGDIPFVSFTGLADRLSVIAAATGNAFKRGIEAMATTVYHAWHSRMDPAHKGRKFVASRTLDDTEEVAVAGLFQTKPGSAGLKSAFRLGVPPSDITITGAELLQAILKGENPKGSSASPLSGIPNKPYYSGLAGHEALVQRACEALLDRGGARTLLLWGMGGLGKSTLAAEVARRVLIGGNAQQALWVPLVAETLVSSASPAQWSSEIVSHLTCALGLLDLVNEPMEAQLQALLANEQLTDAVLVLDNLAASSAQVRELSGLLEPLPVAFTIVTSRSSLGAPSTRSLKVPPLDRQDGVAFIKADAIRRAIEHVLPADARSIVRLCEATGGSPFAMQLALGCATQLPWNTVLDRIPVDHDALYDYLFRDLWHRLSPLAQKLLIYMRNGPLGTGLAELLATGFSPQQAILSAVRELVTLSLVDVDALHESSATYRIHPLTYNFVVSDLPHLWSGHNG
jgi:hypothetical protein